MRKNVFGRRFKRDVNQRKALFKSLASSLVLNERIKTTEAKAKAIKGDAEKLITKVKKEGENAKRLLGKYLTPQAVGKIVEKIAPRFAKRQGGYTRIVRLGRRLSDNSEMVLMEWTEKETVVPKLPKKEQKKVKQGRKRKVGGNKKEKIKNRKDGIKRQTKRNKK